MTVLAVDVGGTKLAAAVVGADGVPVAGRRVPTPVTDDPDAVAAALAALLDAVLAGAGVAPGALRGVGCGCGGPMRWPAGVVAPLNLPGWRAGFPLRAWLGERFPGVPVRVHNDAVAMAVGEHRGGAGRGAAGFLGMVVSTGVGGGLVLGGRLVDGATGNAGHVGHLVVDPAGPPCGCGGRGCLEAYARGPAVAAWAVGQGWVPSGDGSARALTEDARRGDPVARAALARAGRAVGVALAGAVALCDLDVVAVGGGLAQAGPLLLDPLRAAYREHAGMPWQRTARVVPAVLGQEAGLVGAAALVLDGDRYWSGD